jgi:para-aminobenzoate synthetase component I
MNNQISIKEKMNQWGKTGIPFLFIIDFELRKPLIFKIEETNPKKLLYNINGKTNSKSRLKTIKNFDLIKHPESYEEYLVKFTRVKNEIELGNSYLLNLTCSTPVNTGFSLKDVFLNSKSKYSIWFDEKFVCFSPETFVTIHNGVIRSFPMKGTIDAMIPDAGKVILNDPKETAEHYTIVDLIRNDLSMVSKNVRVERFRYIDVIETNEKSLLQVSSEICGNLDDDYKSHLGDILFELLPAGSICGAPKKKTVGIISTVEGSERGYYTGVFGIFDGYNLDSGVMIRFIENKNGNYFYRSGGGITAFSNPQSEYKEMIDKIYVPVV